MQVHSLKLLALGLLALATTSQAIAAPGHHGPGDHQAIRTEFGTYLKTNVLPVMQQQRQKLEAQLTTGDQTQLATYRVQLKALREREHALHQSFRLQGPAPEGATALGRPALTDEQRQQIQQLHTETREIMQKVKAMAEKYASNITQLAQEVQPQQDKWKTDMQAIAVKNAPSDQPGKLAQPVGERLAPGDHIRFDGPGKHDYAAIGHPHFGMMGRFFRPTQFLLMAPGEIAQPEAIIEEHALYPVPVTAATQLEYSLKQAGSVTVQLLDGNGAVLRNLLTESQQTSGPHTQTLDLSNLPSGTYFYKISTPNSSETKRFVK
jgi:hypothetical protein